MSSNSDDSRDTDSDSGNSTDNSASSSDSHVTDDQEEGESSDEELCDQDENLMWCGPRKTVPIVIFRPECMFLKMKRLYAVGEKHHLAYKIVRTDCRVIRQLLHKHGFHEVHPNSSDFNLTWIGCHVKPYTLRSLTEFQKINHFPRSYEITRKDRLYKNFTRLQHSKGAKHFDFLPQSFCTPSEFDDYATAHNRERGTWIVKPVASSRGRGIFLINHPQHLPTDEPFIVSRYISNPLLVDGFKFDVRLYIAVTSYDPLRIYMYEEGLARFATVQYNSSNKTIRNTCMHLTNYSLNKKSEDYVKCNDPDVEDYGNKWSLGALLRYLKKQGKDTKLLLARIEEVVNKVVICAEFPVATACKMFMPHRGNCFELYGFDILIDTNLKPWILEVNLSPSLACDAPIDLKIKSHLMGDLFSLIGFQAQDPMKRKLQQSKRNQEIAASNVLRQQRRRPKSAVNPRRAGSAVRPDSGRANCLTMEERNVVQESKDEYQRRGGWLRIFPSPQSWDKYGNLLECKSGLNQMLHAQLFPDSSNIPSSAHHTSTAGLLVKSKSMKTNHYLLRELQEREIEEHLSQLTRKLLPKDNTSERKHLRSKIRQRKTNHYLLRELQEREIEEHLSQLTRKLLPKDNTSERKHLRSKIRQRYPVVRQITSDVPKKTEIEVKRSVIPQAPKPVSQGVTKSETNIPKASKSDNHGITETKNSIPQAGKPVKDTSNLTATKHSSSQPSSFKTKPSIMTTNGITKPLTSQVYEKHRNLSAGDASSEPKLAQGELQVTNHVIKDVPPEKRIRDGIDVPGIMKNGDNLSKVQARQAFATYLSRVQQRLLEETSRPPERFNETDQNDEQMDLVLRFLKRAAGNLQKPFKVIIPSRKLHIHDRRRILAKQLRDFVQIYSKETEELPEQIDSEGRTDGIAGDRFNKFMVVASEGELEEILTVYTKQNKSAGVFLGSTNHQHTKSSGHENDGPSEGSICRPNTTPTEGGPSNRRPHSAAVHTDTTGTGSLAQSRRPHSAVQTDTAARHFSEGSQQAIQEALQRLAKRQAARQYASPQVNPSSVLGRQMTHHNRTQTQHGNNISENVSQNNSLQRTRSNPNLVKHGAWHEGETSHQSGAYHPVGSVPYSLRPSSAAVMSSTRSKDRPISLQEQQHISHQLTQQNRAKHEEQIAAFHTRSTAAAVRDALRRHNASSSAAQYNIGGTGEGAKRPHPPTTNQSRKPISAQRIARTTHLDDRRLMKYNSISAITKVYGPQRTPSTASVHVLRH